MSRERNVIAAAGSLVTFNCTLDVKCLNRSIGWRRYLLSSDAPVLWYNGRRLRPTLASSGVSVEDSPTHGSSVLTILQVGLSDRGSFQCFVGGLQQCHVNFRLSVTGKHCNIFNIDDKSTLLRNVVNFTVLLGRIAVRTYRCGLLLQTK